eukprot:TRINITY_DN217_c0_g1_i1.p1 TRINITY_DN217_c0_g1~~TRINITY_DN217_c0_g1_i1.p1  ORF type:complete len:129 (-),score=22.67 TRINITY_DN217_c0_g1_i1:71-457(-)
MSSFTSLIPSPMLAVYGATKAYVKHLSLSLADEFRGKVDVMSVAPWWVVTSMTKIRRASLTAVSPDHFVREVMKSVGTADHCDPYWFHALIDALVVWVPHSITASKFIQQQSFVRKRLMLRSAQTTPN